MSKFYEMHDNGGRPFKVEIDQNNTVTLQMVWSGDFDTPENIFVGNSPFNRTTSFSGGHGPDFDGNSLLLQMKMNPYCKKKNFTYIYIGESVKRFKTKTPIVKYVSPVGNNDVPYPYAVDEKGSYYLIIESVILDKVPKEFENDPYDWYYDHTNMTPDYSRIPPKQPIIDLGYDKFFVDKEQYTLSYVPFARKNYRRMLSISKEEKHSGRMYIKMKGEKRRRRLLKRDYVNIMEKYGRMLGFRKLHTEVLVKRR